MSRKIVGLLSALGALIVMSVMQGTSARAEETPVVQRTITDHKRPVVRRKGAPHSLVIVTKAPNDAPDFDFQDRIQQAQALIAQQPVLKDDIQIDKDGKLSHFVWVLAVGQKTGPLTVVRMDE